MGTLQLGQHTSARVSRGRADSCGVVVVVVVLLVVVLLVVVAVVVTLLTATATASNEQMHTHKIQSFPRR